jgi:serine/threonine protein kinase/DNA-binding NarL/FixJ family response regulator
LSRCCFCPFSLVCLQEELARERSGVPPYLKNRYRLVQWLGGGSMGTVYRAHDETLDRDVAVKFLLPERVASKELLARFLREARAVARLSHPNIMTLYDVDCEGPWHYLVLEYVPGQNLHALMVDRGGPFPLDEAVPLLRGVLEALAYAHARDLVHRDIKPENIMRMPNGRVKVTDFGLALARGDVRLTQAGAILGTVLYMAPEAVTGAEVDGRADLYAVGAVLYELLAGRPPFSADTPLAVLSQILNTPPPPLRSVALDVPPLVEHLVLKLLAKDPAERYTSAEEVLAALAGPAARERPAQESPLYAARESAAVESERRHLAQLLQSSAVEPLNLLLAQARAYEQSPSLNPQARMAVSVLSSLARQALQQVRDLESDLYPSTLEALGLEPALEALAAQRMRAHGLQIDLALERLPRRLPSAVELALFRAAQECLDQAVHQAHAGQVRISLHQREGRISLQPADDGPAGTGRPAPGAAGQRIAELGGEVATSVNPQGKFELAASFPLAPPAELTAREMEVLRLLAQGLSNKEVARALNLSPRTVNFHLNNLYGKLGVSSRTEAVVYAMHQGWVPGRPGPPG